MDPRPLLPTVLAPAAPLPAGAVQLLRLVAGDITQLPAGQLIPATVVKAAAGETVLSVAGQSVTLKGMVNLPAGEVINVRVQPGAGQAVAVVGREQPPGTPQQNTLQPNTLRPDVSANRPNAEVPNPTLGMPAIPTPTRRGDVGGEKAMPHPEGGATRSNPTPTGTLARSASTGTAPLATTGTPPQPGVARVNNPYQQAVKPAEPSVIDVIAREPGGQYRVRIDGREATAASPQPLQPGGRYIAQVDRTPVGVVLRPLPESPQLPTTVATAILRTDKPPPLGDTLPSLVKELTQAASPPLPAPRTGSPNFVSTNGEVESVLPPADPKVRAAAAEVRDVATKLLPQPDQPPTAERIKQLVEDGGTHFEAKLARSADPNTPDRPAPPTPHTDLKSGLLSLARTVTDLASAFPAAAATLDGIERQQATNVLSQQNGGMAVFQIPFPDGPHWRTLGLGIEPDRSSQPDSNGRPSGFRVMMHVPLTSLGETWIDASAEANRLRAVLFVSDPTARERVRGELAELRGELQAGGFAEVHLDVRPSGDLTDSQRRKANAIREGVPEGGGLLDVRA